MEKTKKGMVEIPELTLKALKGLLFSNEGVDLSAIVEDLSHGNEDLTAINVGLTYKGLKPKIDETTRFYADYRSLVKYDFISYSLILGVVNVKRTTSSLPYSKDDSEFTAEDFGEWTNESFIAVGYSEWLEMSTNKDEITTYLLNRWNKKND
jgi:hypothetical protein